MLKRKSPLVVAGSFRSSAFQYSWSAWASSEEQTPLLANEETITPTRTTYTAEGRFDTLRMYFGLSLCQEKREHDVIPGRKLAIHSDGVALDVLLKKIDIVPCMRVIGIIDSLRPPESWDTRNFPSVPGAEGFVSLHAEDIWVGLYICDDAL